MTQAASIARSIHSLREMPARKAPKSALAARSGVRRSSTRTDFFPRAGSAGLRPRLAGCFGLGGVGMSGSAGCFSDGGAGARRRELLNGAICAAHVLSRRPIATDNRRDAPAVDVSGLCAPAIAGATHLGNQFGGGLDAHALDPLNAGPWPLGLVKSQWPKCGRLEVFAASGQ